ncbi:hypothetical protein [Virgibacillus sp. CBA3643]|uniref:hypothetical protein n=1 Tax=Virgibacillus sp. CBA3643 TaxID=2942278 RepID=UPI0035A3545F
MPLFEGQIVTDVVTAKDIKQLTGTSTNDFHFSDEDNPQQALDDLLKNWIEKVASHMHTRLGRSISESDKEYLAIQDVLIRTVAKTVAVAQQQRTSPVVQINDFAVSILNTSEVTKDLDKELRPFLKKRVSFFSSLDEYKE